MTDRLMKLYELNERYHDTKEKMAWLGISFYAVFTLGIIRIFTKDINITDWVSYTLIGFLLVILWCVFWFLTFHYQKKRISVKITDELAHSLEKTNNSEKDLKKIFHEINEINKTGVKCSHEYRSTEIPILILLFVLFAAQVSFVVARI